MCYLNYVYLGNNIFGFQKAAKYYFKRDAKNLSDSEISFLINRIKYSNSNI